MLNYRVEFEDKKQNTQKNIWKILCFALSAVFVVLGFLGGFFTYRAMLPKSVSNTNWLVQMIKRYYLEDFTEAEISAAIANGGLNSLLDRYSAVYTPQEYDEETSYSGGARSGFGFTYLNENNELRITFVNKNSPAERAGFLSGDKFLYMKKSSESEYGDLLDYNLFISKLNEVYEGETYNFKVDRGGVETEITATAGGFSLQTVWYEDDAESIGGYKISGLDEKVGYIRFSSFTANAVSEFRSAYNSFIADGNEIMLLDLRNNGGGSTDILAEIASYLIDADDNAVIAYVKYKNGDIRNMTTVKNRYNRQLKKVVVLLNGGTASASESLIGALVDYNSTSLDYLVGADSYGKGIMQTTFVNPLTSYAIKLTVAKIYWPKSNTCIHEVKIKLKEENAKSTYDLQSLRAVEICNLLVV